MTNNEKRKKAKAIAKRIANQYATKGDRLTASIIAHDAALLALDYTK